MVHNKDKSLRRSQSKSHRDSNTNKKITINKQKVRKIGIILGITLIFLLLLSGGVMAGIFIAGVQNTPDFDPEKMHSSLPSEILDQNGELITRLDRDQYRIEVSLETVPEHTQEAFLAIEDSNFYDHRGYDPRGIMRAAVTNLTTTGNPFRGPQGGSTITQQLVKNAFLTPQQHIERKIQELWLSLQVERVYTKDEILEFYLNNSVYFNHNAYGIQAGSQVYFNKDVEELTLEESALLAGVIQHPSRLSPYINPEDAKQRQEVVLNSMKSQNFISDDEYNQAVEISLEEMLAELPDRTYPYPYFVDYVINQELMPILLEYSGLIDPDEARLHAENLLYRGGLTIHTTMDRHIQAQAERVVNNSDNYPTTVTDNSGVTQPQAAVVLSEPETGKLKAVVGGRNYGTDNMFNRSLSRRQPGSVLKPINIYAPAIENNIISPGSVLDDAPTVFDIPGTNRIYTPENFNRSFSGLVTARNALTRSLNVPAVQLYVNELGMSEAAQATKNFGLTTFTENDKNNPAAAIGGWDYGAKPIEVNAAFATLANRGIRTEPHAITQVTDRNDEHIYEVEPSINEVVSEQTAWLVTDMLTDVVNWGTASAVDLGRPAAGKTGTSQSQRDGWLATYTPDLAMTVWMGYDRDDGTGNISSPSRYTTNMVNQIMRPVLEGKEAKGFTRPSGIVGPLAISNKSGLLPSDITPEAHITYDYFKSNMVPNAEDNAFEEVEICQVSEQRTSEQCPEEDLEIEIFLRERDYQETDGRWSGPIGRIPADVDLMAPDEFCETHITPDAVSPYQLSAVYTDHNSVELTWSRTDVEFEEFNIYRQGPNQTEYQLILEHFESTSYLDEDIIEGERYSYRVVGLQDDAEATFRETTSITTEPVDEQSEEELEEETDDSEKEETDLNETNGNNDNDTDNDNPGNIEELPDSEPEQTDDNETTETDEKSDNTYNEIE